jgi:hypothetical protein
MKMFGGSDDDGSNDDKPIGIGMHGWEDDNKDAKRRLAEEIASGLVSGLFCRDEEVWEMVKQIKERK